MITPIMNLKNELLIVARNYLPRILTQGCRDAGHPAFGCFDRNWWHYKIRDFPSIILQQAGYAVWQASEAAILDAPGHAMRELAAGSARFWNKRALCHGAFEEYYPWEQGYPPLAFGTLAVAKLVAEGVVPSEDVRSGLEIAARQLVDRFEPQAANQQVAGVAAMACLKVISPELISDSDFESTLKRTLALQHEEGWYEEYGGPDVGYLSVTVDCLFDILDWTSDERVRQSILKSCQFIAAITAHGTLTTGLHNARNTDYLVPYGLIRAASEFSLEWREGWRTVEGLFGRASDPLHALSSTDDRYLCHYIGHSIFRAVKLLDQVAEIQQQVGKPLISRCTNFPASGHVIWADQETGIQAICSTKKGGIFTLRKGEALVSDYGWWIAGENSQHITHWWSDTWQWTLSESEVMVEGVFFIHDEAESSPLKHIALRFMSLFLGREIIGALKKKLIFHRAQSPYRFKRKVRFQGSAIEVEDRIVGLLDVTLLHAAPRPSKRHVASADSFHREDLGLMRGWTCEETTHQEGEVIKVKRKWE